MKKFLIGLVAASSLFINCLNAQQKDGVSFEDNFNQPALDPGKWQWSREGVSLRDDNLIISKNGHVLTRLVYPEGELEMKLAFSEKPVTGSVCWGWRVKYANNPRITFAMEGSPEIKAVVADEQNFSKHSNYFPTDLTYHIYKIIWAGLKTTFFVDNQEVFSQEIPKTWKMAPRPFTIYNYDANGNIKIDWLKYKSPVKQADFDALQKNLKFDEYQNNPVDIEVTCISDRTAFYRMEPSRNVCIKIRNSGKATYTNWIAELSLSGMNDQVQKLPELKPDATREISYPLNTSLKPGAYELSVKMRPGEDKTARIDKTFPITIIERPLPFQMPVILWETPASKRERDVLKDLGFTHYMIPGLVDENKVFEAGEPVEAKSPGGVEHEKKALDTAFAEGWQVMGYLYPGRIMRTIKPEYYRVDRQGKPFAVEKKRQDICGLFPDVQKFCFNVGASVAKSYGKCPALNIFDLHSECRDAARPSFLQIEKDAFKRYAGSDIPDEVDEKNGVKYKDIKDFPANRVIPDNNPVYVYYKWFYKEGDGWNQLNNAVRKGLETADRKDWWTYYGPATRSPSVWGAGSDLEGISNWTYVYPDPFRIAMCVDQLLAMSKGASKPQKVVNGIQIICYRSLLAPVKTNIEEKAQSSSAWDDNDPNAEYITAPPMSFREAFWTEIARPLNALIFHGKGSLIKVDRKYGYCLTHPQTQYEFKRLISGVVRPFGPMLLQTPDIQCDVAFLESFASQIFARRGNYGWNSGRESVAYLMLHYAQLQPELIYEETILRDGLDKFKLLVMPACDVLPQSVVNSIKGFQKRGGLVVADDALCPAITPDVTIELFDRPSDPKRKNHEDKAKIMKLAADLKTKLKGKYTPGFESSNMEVITRMRRYGQTDYLFAVNDHREYGHYVGQYQASMENGLPSKTKLTLRKAKGAVYDLISGKRKNVETNAAAGLISFDLELGPAEGRMFMVTPEPLADVKIEVPTDVKLNGKAAVKIAVVDAAGQPVPAVVPLSVKIFDPDGREAEYSGYYGAKDGVLEINIDIAPNDACGVWQVSVQELASMMTCNAYMRISE